LKPISAAQARAFDRLAQQKYKIPSIILMENAGRSVAEEALKMLRHKKRVCVVCGVGNNGGDGFVAARHLVNAGVKVSVFIVGKISKLKADPKINYTVLKKMKIEFSNKIKGDLIVDALFGIGLKSKVKEPYASVIEMMNKVKLPILSVDVPSGLDTDSGKVLGVAVKAKRTVTFVAAKNGFFKSDGPKYCGKVIVRDIGIAT
jgi:NAD(P)H-hydrate epimerase